MHILLDYTVNSEFCINSEHKKLNEQCRLAWPENVAFSKFSPRRESRVFSGRKAWFRGCQPIWLGFKYNNASYFIQVVSRIFTPLAIPDFFRLVDFGEYFFVLFLAKVSVKAMLVSGLTIEENLYGSFDKIDIFHKTWHT